MSAGRRRFLASVSAGSVAYLAGCAPPPTSPPAGNDGGTPCPTPPVFERPELDQPPPAYFAQLSMDLDAAVLGNPIILIDLDRMEANVDAILGAVAPLRLRIVEKSLPSIDLLRRVVDRVVAGGGSASFLVLHLPLLPAILGAFPEADVVIGKTHLTSAVERVFQDLLAGTDRAAVAARVAFLADGEERLGELAALAEALGVTLRVAVEIDVGLGRSGLRDPGGLRAMLRTFAAMPERLALAGLLGYDGHVTHTPGATREAAEAEWIESSRAYRAFVDVLREPEFAPLDRADLIFHGGGTTTHPLYADPPIDPALGAPAETPVNDVATGGGVLRPGEYSDYFLSALVPAIFVAAPVLRAYEPGSEAPPALPFFTVEQNAAVFAGRKALTVQGGGWPAYFTYPEVGPPPFAGGGAGVAWVPNQGLMTAPADSPIATGDWIYFHPTSSEVIFQFDRIHLVRDGRLVAETLAAYPRRY